MKLAGLPGLLRRPIACLRKPIGLLRNPVVLLRTPVYKNGGSFDYTRMQYKAPADLAETERLLHTWGDLGMHPGSIYWGRIVGYGGAVYHVLKSVDHPCIDFPEIRQNPADVPIVYRPPMEWGGVIIRATGALAVVTQGYFGIPLNLREAFVYLSLNAGRNIFSDLMPKHGVSLKRWVHNFSQHIKWRKLTDAMMVTAVAYTALSSLKKFMHLKFGAHIEYEMIAVPVSLTIVDSTIQFVTRKLRGFSEGVARLDMLRPVVGNGLASLAFLALGLDYSQHFLYLLICKFFNEVWSGSVEGGHLYKSKKADRVAEFSRIFSLKDYKVPDPAAVAAINLAFILRVKPLADKVFRKIAEDGRVDGISVAPVLRQITGAMFDDRRIKAAAEFIFPVAGQKVYRDRLVEEFEVNRRAFELNYSLAYRRAADPFEQRGVTVAGLEHIPEVLREGMAAAAERAGIKFLVVESPLSANRAIGVPQD